MVGAAADVVAANAAAVRWGEKAKEEERMGVEIERRMNRTKMKMNDVETKWSLSELKKNDKRVISKVC